MGISFTFVTVLSTIVVNYGYDALETVLNGGIFEGTQGLLANCWRRIITLIVVVVFVVAIVPSLVVPKDMDIKKAESTAD